MKSRLEEKGTLEGARGAQSVKCLSLDFGSGHDLTVLEFEPRIRLCADSAEAARDSRSPFSRSPFSFFLSFFLSLSLSLKTNKLKRTR